jgi:hypothetical protein
LVTVSSLIKFSVKASDRPGTEAQIWLKPLAQNWSIFLQPGNIYLLSSVPKITGAAPEQTEVVPCSRVGGVDVPYFL